MTSRLRGLEHRIATTSWISCRQPRYATASRLVRQGEQLYGSCKPHQGAPKDPGAFLGANVCHTGQEVSDRLHIYQGSQEGTTEAGPAVLFPHAGGERQSRHGGHGWSAAWEYVPLDTAALDGVDEALPGHQSVPRDCRRSCHALAHLSGAQPRTAQRTRASDD